MNKNRWRWMCFALCYFGYMSLYICRNNLSIISPILVEQGIATAAQLGLLTGLFSLGYAGGKLLFGAFGDRFNPKMVAAVGIGIAGLSNLLIGLFAARGFILMLFLWILNSLGQSLVWGPCLRLMLVNFPHEQTPFVNSMLVTTTGSGSIAGILIASAVAKISASLGFLVPGIISLSAAGLLLFLFPGKTKQGQAGGATPKGGLIEVLRHSSVRKMLIPAFAHGLIKDNVLNWASLFLVARFMLDLSDLPFFILLIPLISFVGRLSYPIFYRICKNNPIRVSVVCFGGCLLASVPLLMNTSNVWIAVILLVIICTLGNVMNTSFLTVIPLSMEEYGLVSSTASVLDLVTYSGLGISSAVFGTLVEKFGLDGYRMMFAAFILFAAIGMILLWKKAFSLK